MSSARRPGPGDAVAVLALAGTALVIARPILAGGHVTYIDNAVHLAEIHDLAARGATGWSELGFAGFPLGTLHSPLWYGALAALVRLGAPPEPLYCAALLLGYLAPPLALYAVGRVRLGPLAAGGLAWLFLVQPPAIWGIGSPLGGMWTYALATAALVLLFELHSRPALTRRGHLVASVVLAIAALTHLFLLPLVALLAATALATHQLEGTLSRRELRLRLTGFTLSALASAAYWLTLVLVGNQGAAPSQAFDPRALAYRLLLPADAMFLLDERLDEAVRQDASRFGAAPMIALVLLGLGGALARRRSPAVLGRVALRFACVLGASLVLHRYHRLGFLGPVSFRMVEGVRLALALSAIDALAALRAPAWLPRSAGGALAACGVALGVPLGQPLARDNSPEVAEVYGEAREVWAWLRDHQAPDWGRVYLQDTFGYRYRQGGVALTHLPILAARVTGLPQLGTYYGVVPFTLRWSISEFNSLFSTMAPSEAWVAEAMEKLDAGVLVSSNHEMAEHLRSQGLLEELHSVGRFTVFRRPGSAPDPIAELTPANHVEGVVARPGEIRFRLTTDYPSTRVLARTSFHPWWRVDGVPGATLRESPEGFLVVDGIPKGEFDVRLTYRASPIPVAVSGIGWLLLTAWGLLLLRARGEAAT